MQSLAGQTLLVTRPEHQVGPLITMIHDLQGSALHLPVLSVVPKPHQLPSLAYDWVIFISRNAVRYGVQSCLQLASATPQWLAVGASTAASLRECLPEGCMVIQPVLQQSSEGLLALPELQQVQGQRILIVRGVGGKALLGETLSERGASVTYLEVYQRDLPQQINPLTAQQVQQINFILLTSCHSMMNLHQLCGEHWPALCRIPCIVASQSMVDQGLQLGLRHLGVARSACDADMLQAVLEY